MATHSCSIKAILWNSGVGFTKGLKLKICLKSKIKVTFLNVKNFVIKLRQNLCLDKMGFIKVLS